MRGFYEGLGDSMAFDLWVDGNRLPRKIRTATPSGAEMSVAVMLGFSGFDVPTTVAAPPRSQVTDGDNLRNLPGMPA